MSNNTKYSCGCGSCLNLVIFIFIIGALFWSVLTPWGKFELDLFPPAFRINK